MEWIAQLLNLLPPGYQRWLQEPEVLLALSVIVVLPLLALLWWKISKEAEAIEREIGELRHDNNRLTRENEELKGSLISPISSVEDSRLSELPVSFQGVGKKLDAILETDRASNVPAEARATALVGVTADIAARAGQELAPLDAPYFALRKQKKPVAVKKS